MCHAAGEHFIILSSGLVVSQIAELHYFYSAFLSLFEVMVELSSGEYKTTVSPVNVEQVMNQLVLSTGHDKFTIEVETELMVNLCFDEKMAQIILQNALSNAVAHGDDGNVEFTASLRAKGARMIYSCKRSSFFLSLASFSSLVIMYGVNLHQPILCQKFLFL